MKKWIYIFLSFASLLLAFSCVEDKEEQVELPLIRKVCIHASADSRSVLCGDEVKWESDDCISVVFTHPSKGASVTEFHADTKGDRYAPAAEFHGNLSNDISSSAGYAPWGYAIYPSSAVKGDGQVNFVLPDLQTALPDGSVKSGLNISSAAVSLVDIESASSTRVSFHQALSTIRFKVAADVSSVTLTGTSPFAGDAPLIPDLDADGKLVVDSKGKWSDPSCSVTLLPQEGAETFSKGVVYNLLVWPGEHESLTLSLNLKDYGVCEVVSEKSFIVEPSKYYTLDVSSASDGLLAEIKDSIGELEGDISDLNDRIDALGSLLPQIQSVAVVPEYADNVALAPYSVFSSSRKKGEISVNYMIRPADVAEKIVSDFSDAMSAQICCRYAEGGVSFSRLPLSHAELSGDLLNIKVNAEDMSDAFYDGKMEVKLALQIADGTTEILSDFITLVPDLSSALDFVRTDDIPVLKDATVSVPFRYATSGEDVSFSLSVQGVDPSDVRITHFDASRTGYIYLTVKEACEVSDIRVDLRMESGEDVAEQSLTFVEGGRFDVSVSCDVDYIGGEVSLKVMENSFGDYSMQLDAGPWIWQTMMGVDGHYTVAYNEGGERVASVLFTIDTDNPAVNGDLKYTRSVALLQRAYNTPLQGDYLPECTGIVLQSAAADLPYRLNLVILGDGYMKKDFLKGGKFERSAVSAMDAFFGVEPYSHFRNRFNVYMAAYESAAEGPRHESVSSGAHKTYFETWYKGGGNTYVNYSDAGMVKVMDAVKNDLRIDGNDYWRTVVILLVNSSESIGSTNYPSMAVANTSETGDGFASFAVAMVAANSTATGGLVRHEAGGHAFGRLGDEYEVSWYTPELVEERHGLGFYRNIATDLSYWQDFFSAGYTLQEVAYDPYGSGIYRSTHEKGIMWNNNGQFNAVSRHIIYQRIIRQTQGPDSYSWEAFLEYDNMNR